MWWLGQRRPETGSADQFDSAMHRRLLVLAANVVRGTRIPTLNGFDSGWTKLRFVQVDQQTMVSFEARGKLFRASARSGQQICFAPVV